MGTRPRRKGRRRDPGSHVVVVISRHEPPKAPFKDFATLVNKLYWSSYTAVTVYKIYYDVLLKLAQVDWDWTGHGQRFTASQRTRC